MEPRSIRLPGTHGLHLHALEWSREGTLLLFLHGFSNDAHVWDRVAPVLAPHYRVVALDQRGHGDSDRDPEGRYDHETMARDANAAIESLGASRAVIVGHSLGGRVAMRFAGLFPEKLAGLVIVDSAPDLDARGTTRISLDVKQQDWSFDSVAEYERTGERIAPLLGRNGRYADDRLMKRVGGQFTGEMFWCHVTGRALNRAAPHEAGIWSFEDLSASRVVKADLTAREREVAAYMLEGLTSKQIGKALTISHRTVENYKNSILKKLNLHAT